MLPLYTRELYPIGWQGAINRGSALLVGDAKTYCTPGASRWDNPSIAPVTQPFFTCSLLYLVVSLVPQTWALITFVLLMSETRSAVCTVTSTPPSRTSKAMKHCFAALSEHFAASAGFKCNSHFSFTSTQRIIYPAIAVTEGCPLSEA